MNSRWYPGTLVHARTQPLRHVFKYPVSFFAFDLDELADLDRRVALFGHNRRQVFSLRDADYLGSRNGSLRDKLEGHLQSQAIAESPARVVLLTTPRTFGHTFNPISFFYCYDDNGALQRVVVEVNNTFGEGHLYFLSAQADGGIRRDHAKEFHVSPFNDTGGEYDFDLTALDLNINLRIRLRRDDEVVFSASLAATGRDLTSAATRRAVLTYPINTLLTLPRILWQAAKLYYLRRMPFHAKPPPQNEVTYDATYPPYVSEFEAPGKRGAPGDGTVTEKSS
ncbi:MAG: DUF1365 family protein [Acidobacteria bacterium]|nr:DUF1365 family protein [Acidobacteriota bacterium]